MVDNSKKAAVFDFDCTLTKIHTSYAELGMLEIERKHPIKRYRNAILSLRDDRYDEQEIIDLFFGADRLGEIRIMFEKLRSNDVTIFISSRGDCAVIKKILEITGLLSFIAGINANGSGCNTQSKDIYIRNLMTHYDKILYADDDHGEYHILTETLKGRDMDANRLIVRDRPMQFRKQSSIGYIETSHSLDDRDITLLFIPTLRLFTSYNQDPTATGLNSQEMKLIISLLTADLLKTDKPLSESTSSLDVTGNADQDGGYYEMYMKSKSAYVSLCNSRDR